ncbi:MAG TPA: class I SAM-dependent methyltransferase [Bacteriovoracaceae bacterium]|nr:class I SAM-dependent methyltransferase [Bacteriovoracaceae bacterium]
MEKSEYWDEIYKKKDESQQSWFEEIPEKSLEMIDELNLPQRASIVNIGGGESRLVDSLLERGFSNITLLDISKESLEKSKVRLGPKIVPIKFIVSDVTRLKTNEKYDLWHDRATFHFLTTLDDVDNYLKVAYESLNEDGYLIVSTFSKTGPESCSGLTISKYSQEELKLVFSKYFKNTRCFETTHTTPWGTSQDFVYCGFKKIS